MFLEAKKKTPVIYWALVFVASLASSVLAVTVYGWVADKPTHWGIALLCTVFCTAGAIIRDRSSRGHKP